VEEGLLANVRGSRSGREKLCKVLAYGAGISYVSALRNLSKYRLHSVKPIIKYSLIDVMRAARL
jgi:hypothetical protein